MNENPFANYGNLIFGKRFIGRNQEIERMKPRIFNENESGNLAIIGEPKIGKSSLVYHFLDLFSSELIQKRKIQIWLNLGTFNNAVDFFKGLIIQSFKKMVELKIKIPEEMSYLKNQIISKNEINFETFILIQEFFEESKKLKYQIIIVLDEFDYARNLFKELQSSFQKLRELSYKPESRVAFITISRRSIKEIESQVGCSSTFDGIFEKIYLSMFSEEDFDEYIKRFSNNGLKLNNDIKKRLKFYCGNHPYLLEMLGYHLFINSLKISDISLETIYNKCDQSFLEYYDHLCELIKEEDTLKKLVQILSFTILSINPIDLNRFLKYGIIIKNQNKFTCYSEHFNQFMQLLSKDIDIWPLWTETERCLRKLIQKQMSLKFGDSWIENYATKYPNQKDLFENWRSIKNSMKNNFGARASDLLIDYSYPRDIFKIIQTEWLEFTSIFSKDQTYWNVHWKLLSRIRNPLAHSQSDVFQDWEIQQAESYCKEILGYVKKKI